MRVTRKDFQRVDLRGSYVPLQLLVFLPAKIFGLDNTKYSKAIRGKKSYIVSSAVLVADVHRNCLYIDAGSPCENQYVLHGANVWDFPVYRLARKASDGKQKWIHTPYANTAFIPSMRELLNKWT
jgi:hypothetical protein